MYCNIRAVAHYTPLLFNPLFQRHYMHSLTLTLSIGYITMCASKCQDEFREAPGTLFIVRQGKVV